MLFIEIETLELTGGHTEIRLFIEIEKTLLFIESEKLELTGGHIEINRRPFIEIETLELDSTPAILNLC